MFFSIGMEDSSQLAAGFFNRANALNNLPQYGHYYLAFRMIKFILLSPVDHDNRIIFRRRRPAPSRYKAIFQITKGGTDEV
jgi:hypothetical protein